MRRFALVLFLVLGTSLVGCRAVEPASEQECKMAVDHIMTLLAEKEAGSGLGGRLLDLAATGAGKLTGDYQKMVRKCVAEMSRADVACILKADSAGDLDECK